jgi:two-component system, OmpR family, sensor kinase
VSNAVRHTSSEDRISLGSVVHASRVSAACPAGAHVHLWVADSGEGVAPGDRERIFERFARGNDQVRTDGAGLGLAIVRSIAQAHGGDVLLADDDNPGARFELVLPLTPTEESS